MITWDNYEEYMMMHADGELKPAEEQELMNFVFEHPELQNELAAFAMTKMIPDTTTTYSKKQSLTKPETKTKLLPFGNWKRSALAASVVALVCFSFYKATERPDKNPNLTSTNTIANTTIAGATKNNTKKQENNSNATSTPSTPVATEQTGGNVAAVQQTVKTHKTPLKNTATSTQTQKERVATSNDAIANNIHAKEAIDKIEPSYIALATDEKNNFAVAVTNLPDVTIYTDNGQTTQSFLDKLPLDELKKEGMENVASALASGYDKLNAIRHSITESSITLKLQHKKLTVSF